MLPIFVIIAIAGGNTAATSTLISVTSLAVSTVTSAGILTASAITCGATATATILSGGIVFAVHSQQKEVKNETEHNPNLLPLSRIDTTTLLELIPHFYPITHFVNDKEEGILFFINDTTTHEQRLERLQQILEKFSEQIKIFENSFKNDHNKVHELELKLTAPILLKGLEASSQKLKLMPSENENHVNTLDSIIIKYNSLLENLSTTVSRARITSSTFSLAYQIDLIFQSYNHSSNKNSISFFTSIESKIFEEDLLFIRDISHHHKSTDDIRIASLQILKNKNKSYLSKLDAKINELIHISLQYAKNSYDDNEYCKLFADFCHETEGIIPSEIPSNFNIKKSL